jgi:flavin reductase (DIM6/NTAB) family NADH-FMN oxidoreductase RutF
VSIEPPLVLFSVDRRANSLPAMLEAKGFAINVMAREQEDISNRFARALSDKWSAVKRGVGFAQAPLIAGALAHFECEPYANYDGGDHVIFVVRVVRHTVRAGNPAPLIFFRGRYCDLVDESEREPSWAPPFRDDWRAGVTSAAKPLLRTPCTRRQRLSPMLWTAISG